MKCDFARVAAILFSAAAAAGAQAADGWSATLEPEHERVKPAGGDEFSSDTLAATLGYRKGVDKFDFKMEIGKDRDSGAAAGGKAEFRYRRYFAIAGRMVPSLLVSIGNAYRSGAADVSFYTVQPKLAFDWGGAEPFVGLTYRDALDSSSGYRIIMYKCGVAFNLGGGWEIEPELYHKTGDETSNGIVFAIGKHF